MSFTIDVKNELCLVKYETKCCKRAHLAGIVGFGGTVSRENGETTIKIRTESTPISRRAYSLIKELFGIKATLSAVGKLCTISVSHGAETILKELGFLEHGMVRFTINPFLCHDDCCKNAFLAGAFLGGGYVKTPKNGYHFEIKNHYRTLMRDLTDMIEEMGFAPKFVMRKSEYVTYLKQSDAICDILMQMGGRLMLCLRFAM